MHHSTGFMHLYARGVESLCEQDTSGTTEALENTGENLAAAASGSRPGGQAGGP